MEIINTKLELKPYSKKELSAIYGISVKTLNKWVSPFKADVGVMRGRFYNVKQVKLIFEKLGLPGSLGEQVLDEPKKKIA